MKKWWSSHREKTDDVASLSDELLDLDLQILTLTETATRVGNEKETAAAIATICALRRQHFAIQAKLKSLEEG